MNYVLFVKWDKVFSFKKKTTKHQKNTGKNGEKILESQGFFSVRKSGNNVSIFTANFSSS